MMQVRSIRAAIFGISSEMWTPGTEVGIERNGPPVGVPGLGSQVSSWLEPAGQPEQNDVLPPLLQLGGQRRGLQDVERRHVRGERRRAGGQRAEEPAAIERVVGRAAEVTGDESRPWAGSPAGR